MMCCALRLARSALGTKVHIVLQDNYAYLRARDGRSFRFKAKEAADINGSELLDEADAILLTFGLDKDFGDPVVQYQNLVHDSYWDQRKAFHIVGTKQDALDPNLDSVKYSRSMETLFTLYTSVTFKLVGTRSGSGIEELCSSIGVLHTCPTLTVNATQRG